MMADAIPNGFTLPPPDDGTGQAANQNKIPDGFTLPAPTAAQTYQPPIMGTPFITNTIDDILHSMGGAAKDAFHNDVFSKDTMDALRSHGVFGPAQKEQRTYLQSFNQSFYGDIINGAESVTRALNAGVSAIAAGAYQAAKHIGGEPFASDIGAMTELKLQGGLELGAPHLPEIREAPDAPAPAQPSMPTGIRDLQGDATEAARIRLHTEDLPEDQQPAVPPRPEELHAPLPEEPKPGNEPVPLTPEQPVEAPPADIHEAARRVDPETMGKFDALNARADTYRRWLDDLAITRQQMAEAKAPDGAKLQSLQSQLSDIQDQPGLYGKKQKITQQIADIQDRRQTYIDDFTSRDTPDMARVRQVLLKNDYAKRDLAPAVSQAYRDAQNLMPEDVVPETPEAVTEAQSPEDATLISLKVENAPVTMPEAGKSEISAAQPNEETAKTVPADEIGTVEKPGLLAEGNKPEKLGETTQGHLDAIKQDVVDQLVKAGRPENEARAAAEIVASRYEARAAAFEGRRGNALDLYNVKIKGEAALNRIEENELAQSAIRRNAPAGEIPEVVIQHPDSSPARLRADENYKSAKAGDPEAASALVEKFVSDAQINKIKDLIGDQNPTVAFVHAEETRGRNAIPAAYAEEISHRLGLDLDDGIVQSNRAARTGKSGAYRFINGAEFDGAVSKDVPYLLVDDHISQGGTLADMRSYIESHGGRVIGATTLTGAEDATKLAASTGTLDKLSEKFPGIDEWMKEEFGNGINSLTEKEAEYALRHNSLNSLRGELTSRSQEAIDRGIEGDQGEKGSELLQSGRVKAGAFNTETKLIRLFKDANASTFMHEAGHMWLEEFRHDAQDPHAADWMREDFQKTLDFLGVKDNSEIGRKQHEKWARGFERYLYDGQAPSKGLARAFAQFRAWMVNIYSRIRGLAPISNDVRDVFDRLIATNPERQPVADFEPSVKMMADLHEADAETAQPHQAMPAGDIVQSEVGRSVADDENLKKEIPANVAEEGTNGLGVGAEVEPQPTNPGAEAVDTDGRGTGETATSSEVGNGAPETSTEGAPIRAGEGDEGPIGDERPVTIRRKQPDATGDVIDKAGNIRLDLLGTPEDVNEVIREAAAQNGGFFSARRGVLTDGEVMDLADALGMDPGMLNRRQIGDAFNAEQIVAARRLLVQSATNVSNLMKKAVAGDHGALLELAEARARHLMIQEQVSGITAEAGRALRAFRSMDGFRDAQAMSAFLKETQGLDLNQMLLFAEKGADLPTSALSKFVKDSKQPDFGDKMMFYYQNCLLSGPITHARYAVGNVVNVLTRPLFETPLQAASGLVREALTGEKPGVYMGEAMEEMFAIASSWQDAYRAAYQSWKTGNQRILPGKWGTNTFASTNPIGGRIGDVIGAPMRGVASIHSFFETIGYAQNTARLAYRTAMKEGLEGADFDRRVAELKLDPTPEMRDAITGELDQSKMDPEHYANVMQATSDTLAQLYMRPADPGSASAALNRAVNSNRFWKIIVPFLRVGLNITHEALSERTPIGLFDKEIRGNIFSRNGAAAADIQRGKMLFGTSIMGGASAMVMGGLMTGDGPSDPAQRRTWLLTNKPNSIKIGSLWIPYHGLGHLGMLMRFAANMTETAEAWGEEDGQHLAVAFMEGVSKAVLDENFMRGVKDLTDAVYHWPEYGGSYIRSFATNWLPYSVGLGQVSHEIDPVYRDVGSPKLENGFGILNAARAKMPLLSEGLPAKRDVFGEPIGGGVDYKGDKVVMEMQRLQIGASLPSRTISGVRLTEQQYEEYTRIGGRFAKMRLDSIVNSPGWDNVPAFAKIETIKNIIDAAHRQARSMIWLQNPDLRKASIEAKQKDISAR